MKSQLATEILYGKAIEIIEKNISTPEKLKQAAKLLKEAKDSLNKENLPSSLLETKKYSNIPKSILKIKKDWEFSKIASAQSLKKLLKSDNSSQYDFYYFNRSSPGYSVLSKEFLDEYLYIFFNGIILTSLSLNTQTKFVKNLLMMTGDQNLAKHATKEDFGKISEFLIKTKFSNNEFRTSLLNGIYKIILEDQKDFYNFDSIEELIEKMKIDYSFDTILVRFFVSLIKEIKLPLTVITSDQRIRAKNSEKVVFDYSKIANEYLTMVTVIFIDSTGYWLGFGKPAYSQILKYEENQKIQIETNNLAENWMKKYEQEPMRRDSIPYSSNSDHDSFRETSKFDYDYLINLREENRILEGRESDFKKELENKNNKLSIPDRPSIPESRYLKKDINKMAPQKKYKNEDAKLNSYYGSNKNENGNLSLEKKYGLRRYESNDEHNNYSKKFETKILKTETTEFYKSNNPKFDFKEKRPIYDKKYFEIDDEEEEEKSFQPITQNNPKTTFTYSSPTKIVPNPYAKKDKMLNKEIDEVEQLKINQRTIDEIKKNLAKENIKNTNQRESAKRATLIDEKKMNTNSKPEEIYKVDMINKLTGFLQVMENNTIDIFKSLKSRSDAKRKIGKILKEKKENSHPISKITMKKFNLPKARIDGNLIGKDHITETFSQAHRYVSNPVTLPGSSNRHYTINYSTKNDKKVYTKQYERQQTRITKKY